MNESNLTGADELERTVAVLVDECAAVRSELAQVRAETASQGERSTRTIRAYVAAIGAIGAQAALVPEAYDRGEDVLPLAIEVCRVIAAETGQFADVALRLFSDGLAAIA
jgi:hypothetical protein